MLIRINSFNLSKNSLLVKVCSSAPVSAPVDDFFCCLPAVALAASFFLVVPLFPLVCFLAVPVLPFFCCLPVSGLSFFFVVFFSSCFRSFEVSFFSFSCFFLSFLLLRSSPFIFIYSR